MAQSTVELSSLYSALVSSRQEIRILHLYPAADPTDQVQCRLETVSLESASMPQYEAISYVWSELIGIASITVNSELVEDAPASAVNVLRQFRLRSTTRKLWIDALCINKADFGEKSLQVAMMNEIYRRTETTLIWLGSGDDTTKSVLNQFETLSKSV